MFGGLIPRAWLIGVVVVVAVGFVAGVYIKGDRAGAAREALKCERQVAAEQARQARAAEAAISAAEDAATAERTRADELASRLQAFELDLAGRDQVDQCALDPGDAKAINDVR